MDWSQWDNVILGMIVAYWILFCVHWRGMSDGTKQAIYQSKAALVAFFAVDILMRIAVRGVNFEFGTKLFGIHISAIEILAVSRTSTLVSFLFIFSSSLILTVSILDIGLVLGGVCTTGFCR